MKPGRSSTTAELVTLGRALAHGTTAAKQFSDPTALELLSDEGRARVKRIRDGIPPVGFKETAFRGYLAKQTHVMVARTIAIDDAVRASAAPQLVILGAGLDGRAWRMPELREVDVFEVDHPDTQRVKRERAMRLTPAARSIHFVPVDFTRDSLDAALNTAGHDASRRTTWIWEGVVMYLTLADIEATLAIIARRSAPGSRVIILYHAPALRLGIVGFFVRRVGEPFLSRFKPDAMRALLAGYGFGVVRDDSMPTIGAALPSEVAQATRYTKHTRVVTAERTAPGTGTSA